jgi:hypothetical protein
MENMNLCLDNETVALIQANPGRYQWQWVQSDAGTNYYALMDTKRDAKGDFLKTEPVVRLDTSGVKTDSLFEKKKDPVTNSVTSTYAQNKKNNYVQK